MHLRGICRQNSGPNTMHYAITIMQLSTFNDPMEHFRYPKFLCNYPLFTIYTAKLLQTVPDYDELNILSGVCISIRAEYVGKPRSVPG